MPRLAAALLCALAAVAAMAAPAPKPRPWVRGWERPIDPLRDCKFDREGDMLTITVPEPGHELSLGVGGTCLTAPRLLRDVEGDFVAQVRVGGSFRPTGRSGRHLAGLVLTDGTTFFLVGRAAGAEVSMGRRFRSPPRLAVKFSPAGRLEAPGGRLDFKNEGLPVEGPAYLRLSRLGDLLRMECSEGGKGWTLFRYGTIELPRKVKVGVFAESTAAGKFRVRFDRFRLSRPKK